MEASEYRHTINNIDQIWDYIRGGRGMFTMESQVSGTHITYKVGCPKDLEEGKPKPLFIKFLAPDDFYFIGTIWEDKIEYKHSAKARASEDSASVKGLKWLVKHIQQKKNLPKDMAFWHEGICAVCGRPLTNPESIEAGIGPICAGR